MDLAEYYALIRPLPLPTDEQFASFACHVTHVHSWYKHLPLHGAHFAVFFDPNAGGGFSEDQPRLHHSWQTRGQYVERFAHLSYVHRRAPNAPWASDYQLNARVSLNPDGTGSLVDRRETPVPDLPKEIERDAGFTLYPFACDNGVFFHRFEDELRRILEGELEHPCAELLSEYYRTQTAHLLASDEFWNAGVRRFEGGIPCRGTPPTRYADKPLDSWGYVRAEEDALAEIGRDPARRNELSAMELEYFHSRSAASRAWWELAQHEHQTVTLALEALRRHLYAAGMRAE
jgi:hypothetical protein